MTESSIVQSKFLATFLKFLGAYALVNIFLLQSGDGVFEHLHLLLDTGTGMLALLLALLLALFLLAEQYNNIEKRVRLYLVAGFTFLASTEILHALVGIEWSGSLELIETYSHAIRPATWPPSTYVLPLALAWILWLEQRKVTLPVGRFVFGVAIVTVLLYLLSWMLPRYADTGILGIQRPTQIPLLFIWLGVIAMCWRARARHPLYEALAWMGVLLFLSNLCMLYSTAPHEKMAMMAHVGKFSAYLFLHLALMRIAAEESRGRKAAESALRESEQSFRGVFDNAADGILIVGMDGYVRDANPEACRMHGYTHDEFVGKHGSVWVHAESAGKFGEALASMQAGKGYSAEAVNLRKDGTLIPIEVRISPFSYQGEPVLLGFVRDITERKQAETVLRESEARLNEAQHLAQIGNWELDILNNRLIWSDEIFQLFEIGKSDFGATYEAFLNAIHPDDRDAVNSAYTRSLETREPYEITHRLKMADGRIKWVTERGHSFFDTKGKPTKSVGTIQDVTALKMAEMEIRDLAFLDSLTALPNRRLLLDRLSIALSLSERSRHYGALLFIDMDKFKALNDTLGHNIGDMLLVEVASRIKHCVREVDTVARLGGDEFVVLLEEVDAHAELASRKVALIAEKIRKSLSEPYQLGEYVQHSTPSIGVCLYRGTEQPVDALLKSADIAMYQAKDAGRNAVRFFDPAMQQAVESRAALETDLRHAVPEQQLQLYYQIQMDSELRPLGAEALIRWVHPTRGMVSPMQFIPIAEESGLILEIGNWVLDTACRQLARWAKHEQTVNLLIAVNVSAQQFKQPDFVEAIAKTLRTHAIDPSRLKLELTESVVLDDVQGVVAKMHTLKTLGVCLSMDDFGTGYSSLSYLKQLPLDQIKIDQSFVRDMISDPNDAVMVRTIIDMANNFHLNVIAEGVETEAQMDFLRQLGCLNYQGYYFSKPVPVAEFEALLKQG